MPMLWTQQSLCTLSSPLKADAFAPEASPPRWPCAAFPRRSRFEIRGHRIARRAVSTSLAMLRGNSALATVRPSVAARRHRPYCNPPNDFPPFPIQHRTMVPDTAATSDDWFITHSSVARPLKVIVSCGATAGNPCHFQARDNCNCLFDGG